MSTSSRRTFDVVVIGAGPSGLISSLYARRAGFSVALIEKLPEPGGMSRSISIANQSVDLGSHRLHYAMGDRVWAELEGLLSLKLQIRRRKGRIRVGDTWVNYPLSLMNLFSDLPFSVFKNLLLDQITRLFKSKTDHVNFTDRIIGSFGPTLFNLFYRPYALKLWGTPPDELSVLVADQRVSALSIRSRIQRLIPFFNSRWKRFLYPVGGYGEIAKALAAEAESSGVEFFYNASVTEINATSPNSCVISTETGSFETKNVWSTLPVTQIASLMMPPAPTEIIQLSNELTHRAMVLLYVVVDQAQYTEFDAHYIPDSDSIISRISEPKNYSDVSGSSATTVLCVEIPCWRGDSVWQSSDEALRDQVIEEMQSMGLPQVIGSDVHSYRLGHVYPVMKQGFEKHLVSLSEWLQSYNWLLVFGRQGLFVPDNLHHALDMGICAVDALSSDGVIDREQWQESLKQFKEHVVED